MRRPPAANPDQGPGVDFIPRETYITDRLYNQAVTEEMQQPDPLSTTFAALADPTRRAILARLAKGEASVKDLSEPFDMSQPAISKHLRVLERAGLIEQGRQAQWRPRRLRAGPLRDIADWVDQYRRHWEESFERLDDYLRELQDIPGQGKGADDDRDENRPG
jgi:DNA-binding transcriptional ArsR family regulator